MTKEQEQIWAILRDDYASLAHIILDDMYVCGEIDYQKADTYFEYILDNWPHEEIFRATKTWLVSCPLDNRKLKTFKRLIDMYAEVILANTKRYELYQKHTRSPINLTKTK
jgi:hypothetical protein